MAFRQYGTHLLKPISVDLNLGNVIQRAKEINRRNRNLMLRRQRRSEAHPYRKTQYIDAFVQAQSVRIARQQRLRTLATKDRALLAEMEPSNFLVAQCEGDFRSSITRASPTGGAPVVFGSWRCGSAEVERACRTIDRNLHCIVRGATTPPVFSQVALQRDLPMRLSSIQRLLKHIREFGCGGDAGKPWEGGAAKRFNRMFASCAKSACLNQPKATLKLMGVVLQTAGEQGWVLALQMYSGVTLPYYQLHWAQQSRKEKTEALSFLVAVLCESIRSNSGGSVYGCRPNGGGGGRPPYELLEKLVKMVPEPLLPVAAAPVFSILHPDGGAGRDVGCGSSANATWYDAVRLFECFQPRGQVRLYLPSLAWAELLRAIRRMGGSVGSIQDVVDIVTDSERTKHGDKHMCDTHIWNAYLACSDWRHALDLFENQWKYYGVKETAETTAALMESLLRDGRSKQALDLFHRLQQKQGQLIVLTSSVLSAAFRALEQQRDWNCFTSLLLDFDRFLVALNVPHDWGLLTELQARKNRGAPCDSEELELWRAFVGELCKSQDVTREVQLAVEGAFVACDPLARREPAEGEVKNLMTVEDLYDSMQEEERVAEGSK